MNKILVNAGNGKYVLDFNLSEIAASSYKYLTRNEFSRYFIVGIFATIADWGSFYIFAYKINLYYQFALAISFSLGCTSNYILNKSFTFRCKSKKIIRQFSVFWVVSLVSLLLSMGVMFVLVDLILLQKMASRIATTFTMLAANYTMHKYLTFNRRFFR